MFKKLIFSVLFLAALVGASAQHVPGSWKIIPMTGSTFEYVQETPSKVYYMSSGSLYSYDKDSQETMYYSPGTKISDSGIKMFSYNGDKKYLALVYTNGNIDLIYENGKVVNLPEIKDSNLAVTKTINNIQFGKDRLYVATAFGIVVYDDVNHYVVESGIYNTNIPQVIELGDNLMIWKGSTLAFSPKRDRHNTLDKFKEIGTLGYDNVQALNDNSYLYISGSAVYKAVINFNETNPISMYQLVKVVDTPSGKKLTKYKNGYYVAGTSGFYLIDNVGNYAGSVVSYPSSFASQTLSFWDSPSEFWAANADGIGKYALSGGQTTVLNEKYFPESSKQKKTWYSMSSPNGEEVYISEVGRTQVHPGADVSNNFFNYKLNHEVYNWRTQKIKSVAPVDESGNILTNSSSRVLYDPDDPSYVYIGSLFLGLNVIKDGVLWKRYDGSNSPVNSGWGSQIYDMGFDRQGNLWMTMWLTGATNVAGTKSEPVKMLTKAGLQKLKTDPDAISELVTGTDGKSVYSYWVQPDWNGYMGSCDGKIILSSKADKGIVCNGGWGSDIIGFDYKGTTTADDDVCQLYSGIRDQDGTISTPVRKPWLEEDKNGWIWIGTDAGIYIVKDINQIADRSSNFLECVRPKVARNDGTDYADYLLASDFIENIAVDSNNRKWIATTTSGLYCVSPDGTEILQNFTKDNSPLVSNVVTMVACDPHGNDVLIGTPEGLYVYSSDSAPANDDYSEVYAFPNPVRPDYTGWITINGLMDNSLLKITDAQGSVVWEGRSEGGMAVWDGCDSAGNRVRSGVYMVMASQNSDGTSGGVVTKIVVIN